MTTLKSRDVTTGLKRKGFEERKGSHLFFILYVDGKKTCIQTMVSHGMREIGDSLISKMARQTKLNSKGFVDLVTCPLSREAYIAELRKQGAL